MYHVSDAGFEVFHKSINVNFLVVFVRENREASSVDTFYTFENPHILDIGIIILIWCHQPHTLLMADSVCQAVSLHICTEKAILQSI